MSVSGLCNICENADVEHGCDRCGKLVCDRHWDETTGLCTECSAETGGGRGKSEEPTNPDDMPDGVDTYEF
ncbi:hypothetical protein [Haloarcula amylovorans]|uniref:hypothetical protein n=1 Tax=Haloarcula amylovorans TaxID=2562280 RepID=UPI0010761CEE|nr:hypothetical protein [Halomicroarcula amylolytica]